MYENERFLKEAMSVNHLRKQKNLYLGNAQKLKHGLKSMF